jgi:hypothetical protein
MKKKKKVSRPDLRAAKIALLGLLHDFGIGRFRTWSLMREGFQNIPEPHADHVVDITISGLMTYFEVTPRRKRGNSC